MDTLDSPLLSVVVPCYNEQESLPELYRRLTEVCSPYAAQGYEIILVNDGSRDGTWPLIQGLHAHDPRVVGLCFSRNFGHSMALSAGLDAARGQRVMIIDADLQDPPELLHSMMQHMDNGADVVYGKRRIREGETWFKRTTASLFYQLINRISDVPMPRDTGDFRLINRKVVEVLRSMPEATRYIRGMIAWVGFNQIALEYDRKERFAGTTHYTLEKMLRLALDAITGFTERPLRISFYLGFVMLLINVALLTYVAVAYITHNTVRGWASIAAIISGTQALQWFMLGLMGEYIGRIYREVKNRPLYVISATTDQ